MSQFWARTLAIPALLAAAITGTHCTTIRDIFGYKRPPKQARATHRYED